MRLVNPGFSIVCSFLGSHQLHHACHLLPQRQIYHFEDGYLATSCFPARRRALRADGIAADSSKSTNSSIETTMPRALAWKLVRSCDITSRSRIFPKVTGLKNKSWAEVTIWRVLVEACLPTHLPLEMSCSDDNSLLVGFSFKGLGRTKGPCPDLRYPHLALRFLCTFHSRERYVFNPRTCLDGHGSFQFFAQYIP